MASRRRNAVRYDTYGSVAYAPAYEGSAVRAPRREEEQRNSPRPQVRERRGTRELTRTRVQVREAGQVAPFAVIGFAAVAVLAVLLLGSYSRLTVEYGQMMDLQGELTALETENATLTAQYEKAFDLETLQQAVGDTMVRPTGDQVVYIDLSEPDTVEVFQEDGLQSRLTGAVEKAGRALSGVAEYFR